MGAKAEEVRRMPTLFMMNKNIFKGSLLCDYVIRRK
jgi:hypothetical protein